jgi:hypothetical protein
VSSGEETGGVRAIEESRYVSETIPLAGAEKSRLRPSMKAHVYLPCIFLAVWVSVARR